MDIFANLSLSRMQHTRACYCRWCHTDGPCAVCTAEYRPVVPCIIVCARQCLLGSACWAMPAGRCLPAPLGQPVHSCVQLSHHRWRKLHLLSHSPACSVIHIHTLDVDDYKWHEYLDLTISECISVYTCTGQLGQENLSPFM